MRSLVVICAPAVLSVPSGIPARTWYVAPNGTGDAPTIQAAVDSAADYDVIELADGTYTGSSNRDIAVYDKYVSVRSESGNRDACIIDCQLAAPAFRVSEVYTGAGLSLYDLTIKRGKRNCSGIDCYSASANAHDCVFSYGQGTVITWTWGQAFIFCEDCMFKYNACTGNGGLLRLEVRADGEFARCLFVGNSASKGGVIYCGDMCGTRFTNCTFVDNSATDGGVFHCGYESAGCGIDVTRSIITGTGGEVASCPYRCCLDLTLCDLYDNPVGDWAGCLAGQAGISGNFSADPLFCDAGRGDYSIDAISPCAAGNHPTGYDSCLIGALDVGCGCPSTEPSTWGAIKAIYR